VTPLTSSMFFLKVYFHYLNIIITIILVSCVYYFACLLISIVWLCFDLLLLLLFICLFILLSFAPHHCCALLLFFGSSLLCIVVFCCHWFLVATHCYSSLSCVATIPQFFIVGCYCSLLLCTIVALQLFIVGHYHSSLLCVATTFQFLVIVHYHHSTRHLFDLPMLLGSSLMCVFVIPPLLMWFGYLNLVQPPTFAFEQVRKRKHETQASSSIFSRWVFIFFSLF